MTATERPAITDVLTRTELGYLRLYALPMTVKEVARASDRGVDTIEEAFASVRRKLGVRTTREAARLLGEQEHPPENRGAAKAGDAAQTRLGERSAHEHSDRNRPLERGPAPAAAHHLERAGTGALRVGGLDRSAAADQRPLAGPRAADALPPAGRRVARRLQSGSGVDWRPFFVGGEEWGGRNGLGAPEKFALAAIIMMLSLLAFGGASYGLRFLGDTFPPDHIQRH